MTTPHRTRKQRPHKPLRRQTGAALAGLLAATLLDSPATFAWGNAGHEIAAQIATPYLSEHSRRHISSLLEGETLASASTWADRMRSDPSRFWQEEAGPYHYVTVPEGRRYEAVGPPPQGDAVTALTRFGNDLRSASVSRTRKQLALRFAIHIIQDLQQPMHVGNGRDRGGNQVAVTINGEASNFHSLWDRQLLDSAQRSQRQWLSYFKRRGLLREPTAIDAEPLVWIAESAALRTSLYPVSPIIDAEYLRRERPRAEARLVLAGIRTAAWLNATLEQTPASDHNDRPVPGIQNKLRKPWWQRIFGV